MICKFAFLRLYSHTEDLAREEGWRTAFSSFRAPAKMKFLWEAKEQWSE